MCQVVYAYMSCCICTCRVLECLSDISYCTYYNLQISWCIMLKDVEIIYYIYKNTTVDTLPVQFVTII